MAGPCGGIPRASSLGWRFCGPCWQLQQCLPSWTLAGPDGAVIERWLRPRVPAPFVSASTPRSVAPSHMGWRAVCPSLLAPIAVRWRHTKPRLGCGDEGGRDVCPGLSLGVRREPGRGGGGWLGRRAVLAGGCGTSGGVRARAPLSALQRPAAREGLAGRVGISRGPGALATLCH